MAVTTGGIVERVDVVGDVLGRCIAIFVNALFDSFLLETAEKGFRDGVIPTVASAAHARFKPVRFAEPSPGVAAVLRALIGMYQRTVRSSATHRHEDSIEHELAMDGHSSRPAHYPS